MIEVALMIEGQDGLNWDRWRKIARVAEDAGYVGLYRSDHFTNPQGPYKDSLECWTSLTWLECRRQNPITGYVTNRRSTEMHLNVKWPPPTNIGKER